MDLGFAFYKSEFNKAVFKTFVQILNVTFFSVITYAEYFRQILPPQCIDFNFNRLF